MSRPTATTYNPACHVCGGSLRRLPPDRKCDTRSVTPSRNGSNPELVNTRFRTACPRHFMFKLPAPPFAVAPPLPCVHHTRDRCKPLDYKDKTTWVCQCPPLTPGLQILSSRMQQEVLSESTTRSRRIKVVVLPKATLTASQYCCGHINSNLPIYVCRHRTKAPSLSRLRSTTIPPALGAHNLTLSPTKQSTENVMCCSWVVSVRI